MARTGLHACAAALVVALAHAGGGQSITTAVPPGSIRVHTDARTVVLMASDLSTLSRHEVRVVAEGSSDSVTVSGVSLWDVLQKAGVPASEASGRQRAVMYVRLMGADGQGALFALVEVDPGFSKRSVLLADRRNAQPLDAVEGPWRAIVPDDTRHARWIRGLVSIDVGQIKP
jgi:hypothetical protein